MGDSIEPQKVSTNKKGHSISSVGWFVCALGAIFYSYEYFLRISPSVMEGPLRQHYVLDAGGFGALSALYYYAYVPMQLPVGIMMDRFGPRRLLTFACILCVLGTYLFAASNSVYIAGIGRFIVGFGSAFAFVGVLKLATIWLPEDKLAMVSGASAALGTVGAMIGDNLLGVLVGNLGWQSTINITALVGIFLAVILWLYIKDRSDESEGTDYEENFSHGLHDLMDILTSKQIWINGLYGCLVYLPTTVIAELWGIPYLQHAHHLSHEAASLGNSFLFFGFTFGAPLMGIFSDRIHNRRLPMQIGALGSLACVLVILYVPNLSSPVINTVMFIMGLFYGAQAIVFAVAREVSHDAAGGTAIATTNMIVMLGGMLLQPLVGLLLDYSDKMTHPANADLLVGTPVEHTAFYATVDYQFALAIVPIGMFLAFLCTFLLKETHASRPSH